MSDYPAVPDCMLPTDPLPPRSTWLMIGPQQWITQQLLQLASQQKASTDLESLLVMDSRARAEQPTDQPTGSDSWIHADFWTNKVPGKQLTRILGRSYDRVVLDWRHDWQINHLSQAAGTLRAGGQLVILLAEHNLWSERYGWQQDDGVRSCQGSVYFPWWFRKMVNEGAQKLTPSGPANQLPALPESNKGPRAPGPSSTHGLQPVTADQCRAVMTINELPNRTVLVLLAERGRGKTLSLVLGAKALAAKGHSVVISAGLTDHLQVVQYWLDQALSAKQRTWVQCLPWQQLSADALVNTTLLVDEAAVLGVPKLQWLSRNANRLVLATTTAGYEGSGLGFLLRFLPWLRVQSQVQELTMDQPIRWAVNDPVDHQLRKALLYPESDLEKAVTMKVGTNSTALMAAMYEPIKLDASALLNDPQTRAEWVNLLAESHYQTRPDDVRQCLDNPAISVWGVRAADALVGLMIVLEESPLSAEMGDAVWRGERRPPDQLGKQSLIGQLGHRPAKNWRGARIWRLVVHPEWRRQGIAAALVQSLTKQLRTNGHDYVATSFGLTKNLWAFWSELAWQPVRLGHRRDPASGEQSLLALMPLQPEVEQWSRQAATALGESCLLLPESARALNDPALLTELARAMPPPALSEFEKSRLHHWCSSHQPEASAPLILARALWLAIYQTDKSSLPDTPTLYAWVKRLWCQESWSDIQADLHLTDRRATQNKLRKFLLAKADHSD